MPSQVLPTMSTDGWVDSPTVKADRLFAHFLVSEYSQTALYTGNVSSLAYLIQKNKEAPMSTANEIKTALNVYFSRYYDQVEVDCNWTDVDPEGGKAEIQIYASLIDSDGISISLGRAISIVDSKVQKVAALNN